MAKIAHKNITIPTGSKLSEWKNAIKNPAIEPNRKRVSPIIAFAEPLSSGTRLSKTAVPFPKMIPIHPTNQT
ncbi:MAG: hypothetical protein KBE41_08660, partial [Lutibacter sp.]|nr:hypothetical protein [Lutibacter sp.]